MSECLHMGFFAASVPAVQTMEPDQSGGRGKHELGRQLESPVSVIYK